MKSKSKKPNLGIIVILYLLAALFLVYGIYRVYCSIEYVLTYDSNAAVSTANILQYVVSDSAMYFGFAIVIFAAAYLMQSMRKLQLAAVPAATEIKEHGFIPEPEPKTAPETKQDAEALPKTEAEAGLGIEPDAEFKAEPKAAFDTEASAGFGAEPKPPFEAEQEDTILSSSISEPGQIAETPDSQASETRQRTETLQSLASDPKQNEAGQESSHSAEIEQSAGMQEPSSSVGMEQSAETPSDSALSWKAASRSKEQKPLPDLHENDPSIAGTVNPHGFMETPSFISPASANTAYQVDEPAATARTKRQQDFSRPAPFTDTEPAAITRTAHDATKTESVNGTKRSIDQDLYHMNPTPKETTATHASDEPAQEISEVASVESAFGKLKSAFKKSSPGFNKTEPKATKTRKAHEFTDASSPAVPTGMDTIRQVGKPEDVIPSERPHEANEPIKATRPERPYGFAKPADAEPPKTSARRNEPAYKERPHELADPKPVIELEFESEAPAQSNTDSKFDVKYETVTISDPNHVPDTNDNDPDEISFEQRISDTIRLSKKDQDALSIRSILEDQ